MTIIQLLAAACRIYDCKLTAGLMEVMACNWPGWRNFVGAIPTTTRTTEKSNYGQGTAGHMKVGKHEQPPVARFETPVVNELLMSAMAP